MRVYTFSGNDKATDVNMQQIKALLYPCFPISSAGNRAMLISFFERNKLLNLGSLAFHTGKQYEKQKQNVCVPFMQLMIIDQMYLPMITGVYMYVHAREQSNAAGATPLTILQV